MKNPRITQSEIEIIKKAKAGDESAFSALFNKYKGFVENLLYQYLKDYDEAKDITNVVFLKVYNKLSLFKAYDSFGGWLRMLTNRTAIDYLRETKNKKSVSTLSDNRQLLNIEDSSSENEFVNRLTYEQLISEFKKLPEQTKKICLLFYKENLTIVQISEILSIPTGTIKSILHRIRKKLKKQIKS